MMATATLLVLVHHFDDLPELLNALKRQRAQHDDHLRAALVAKAGKAASDGCRRSPNRTRRLARPPREEALHRRSPRALDAGGVAPAAGTRLLDRLIAGAHQARCSRPRRSRPPVAASVGGGQRSSAADHAV